MERLHDNSSHSLWRVKTLSQHTNSLQAARCRLQSMPKPPLKRLSTWFPRLSFHHLTPDHLMRHTTRPKYSTNHRHHPIHSSSTLFMSIVRRTGTSRVASTSGDYSNRPKVDFQLPQTCSSLPATTSNTPTFYSSTSSRPDNFD